MALGLSSSTIENKCINYDPNVHDPSKMVKIDAMFFTATEEEVKLQPVNEGENESSKLKYLDYDTIILCNPNAMAY
jgi:hypothetical protein